MNRAERRRLKITKRNNQLVRLFNKREAVLVTTKTDTEDCPDCSADVELWVEQSGLTHMVVKHDETCPRLQLHIGS